MVISYIVVVLTLYLKLPKPVSPRCYPKGGGDCVV